MQQFTVSELWGHMGPFARAVVYVLGAMSIASAGVMAERTIVYFRSRRDSLRFLAALDRTLAAQGLDAAALAAADGEAGAGHVGRVLGAGLGAYRATGGGLHSPGLTLESVARALERQAQREHQTLRAGLGVLATVASTAPFVGLLGTVVGIVSAFQAMARAGAGGLGTVSAGIAEALVTTAFGLLVAIPAVMAGNGMTGWIEARMVDVAEASNELLDAVARALDARGQAPRAGAPEQGTRGAA
jgi:biopolymer transport protein ExbB/biopolymer transport protein TolQ